jgi:hypothetical protein
LRRRFIQDKIPEGIPVILEIFNEDGEMHQDLVVINNREWLFPVILAQVSHGKYLPEQVNVMVTLRLQNLFEFHNFHIIWRE